jgi:hypothetical protein
MCVHVCVCVYFAYSKHYQMKVRRQQFENYRNQQELQKQQRAKISQLESMTGDATGQVGVAWKVS